MRNLISFNGLYNIFFVLGFFSLTYAMNLYIVFACAILFCLFLGSDVRHRKGFYVYLVSVGVLTTFYLLIHDGGAAYRIFKTLTLIWLTLYIPLVNDLRITKLLHCFLLFNAALIYIDVVLYNTLGLSLTTGVETHGFRRFSGVIEDSNFFSYLLFVYIYYLKVKTGHFNYFLIGAVLLSFSLSLIITMFGVIILFHVKKLWVLPNRNVKVLGGMVLVGVFVIYYGMLFVLTTLRDVDTSNDYIAEKLVSLSLRFESQLEAFDALELNDDYCWGLGAGKTREITTEGMNLHNSYLQILLEMGIVCLLIVFACAFYCYYFLDKNFVLLFVAIFLLGNVLEIFYFPLLSFILFLSYVYRQEKVASKLDVSDNIVSC